MRRPEFKEFLLRNRREGGSTVMVDDGNMALSYVVDEDQGSAVYVRRPDIVPVKIVQANAEAIHQVSQTREQQPGKLSARAIWGRSYPQDGYVGKIYRVTLPPFNPDDAIVSVTLFSTNEIDLERLGASRDSFRAQNDRWQLYQNQTERRTSSRPRRNRH